MDPRTMSGLQSQATQHIAESFVRLLNLELNCVDVILKLIDKWDTHNIIVHVPGTTSTPAALLPAALPLIPAVLLLHS